MNFKKAYEGQRIWLDARKRMQTEIWRIIRKRGGRSYVWFYSVIRDGPQYEVWYYTSNRRRKKYRLLIPWEYVSYPISQLDWSDVDNEENYTMSGNVRRYRLGLNCPMEVS